MTINFHSSFVSAVVLGLVFAGCGGSGGGGQVIPMDAGASDVAGPEADVGGGKAPGKKGAPIGNMPIEDGGIENDAPTSAGGSGGAGNGGAGGANVGGAGGTGGANAGGTGGTGGGGTGGANAGGTGGATSVPCVPNAWTHEVVDSAPDTGDSIAMALDAAGNVHIAYGNATRNDSFYASYMNNRWTLEKVDATTSNTGREGMGIAVAPDGVVYISDRNTTTKSLLMHTRSRNGTWSYEVADDFDTGWESAMVLDSANNIHISSYAPTAQILRYARRTGSVWTRVTADNDPDDDVGYYSSIGLVGGVVHIMYYDNTASRMRHASNEGGPWKNATVLPLEDAGWSAGPTAMAVDGNDLHVCYLSYVGRDIGYVARTAAGWQVGEPVETAGEVGWYCSIALDRARGKRPMISHYDRSAGQLKFSKKVNGVWSTEVVDADIGRFLEDDYVGATGIAVDATGRVHIAYQDTGTGHLKHATSCPR